MEFILRQQKLFLLSLKTPRTDLITVERQGNEKVDFVYNIRFSDLY